MVERDVVIGKLALLDRALQRIDDVRSRRGSLHPVDAEEMIVLNLQRAAQAAIDLASHVVASEGWTLADTLGANFAILAEKSVIPAELAEKLRRMAGFRNIAVHSYEEIDSKIVEWIVENQLGDLRGFGSRLIQHFDLGEKGTKKP